jgi:hypothetical protein
MNIYIYVCDIYIYARDVRNEIKKKGGAVVEFTMERKKKRKRRTKKETKKIYLLENAGYSGPWDTSI